MTNSPIPEGQREAVGVQTNGIGKQTQAHLNLTVDMAGQVDAEVAQKDRFCAYGRMRRKSSGVAPARRPVINGTPHGWAK